MCLDSFIAVQSDGENVSSPQLGPETIRPAIKSPRSQFCRSRQHHWSGTKRKGPVKPSEAIAPVGEVRSVECYQRLDLFICREHVQDGLTRCLVSEIIPDAQTNILHAI